MNHLYRDFLLSNIAAFVREVQVSEGFDSPTVKGTAREIFVGKLLRPYLNPTVDVCSGTIVDSSGNQSNQIDIIIYDKGIVPPLLLTQFEGVIPIESVLGTIEVKSSLSSKELKHSITNARSVKLLAPFFAEIRKSAPIKKSPLCYVYACKSDLVRKPEAERLRWAAWKENQTGNPKVSVPISGICIMSKSFTRCIRAEGTPIYEEIKQNAKVNVTMLFLSNVIDFCNHIALQRGRIFIQKYFFGDLDI
jgi:hypothetical protein